VTKNDFINVSKKHKNTSHQITVSQYVRVLEEQFLGYFAHTHREEQGG